MKEMSVEVKASTNALHLIAGRQDCKYKIILKSTTYKSPQEIGHVSNPGQKIPSAVFSCDSPLGLETKVKLQLLSCLKMFNQLSLSPGDKVVVG